MRTAPRPHPQGFTLLELIVVIVILGVLAALAIPTFRGVINRSHDETTLAGMQSVARSAQSLHAFGDTTWEAATITATSEVAAGASPDATRKAAVTNQIPQDGAVGADGVARGRYDQISHTIATDQQHVLSVGHSPSGKLCYVLFGRTSVVDAACSKLGLTSGTPLQNAGTVIALPSGFTTTPGGSGGGTAPTEPLDPRMVLTYNFSLPGCPDRSIILPVQGDMDGTVTWAEGTSVPLSEGITHTFPSGGAHQVVIDGTFSNVEVGKTDGPCLQSVDTWSGDTQTTSLAYAFENARNLTQVATPPAGITDLNNTFRDATSFNQNINNWDVSQVADMSSTFRGATSFNSPLAAWDTQNVEYMYATFMGASSFNQNINSWDVSQVTDMMSLFEQASSFNQPLDMWQTGSVTEMYGVFASASSFNQNINNWDVSQVESMEEMFAHATSFNEPLDKWQTGSVITMRYLFWDATSFEQDINSWNVSQVRDFTGTFWGATSFTSPLNMWDTSRATLMHGMFQGATSFDSNISAWNITKVILIGNMFHGATSFSQDLSTWRFSPGTNKAGYDTNTPAWPALHKPRF